MNRSVLDSKKEPSFMSSTTKNRFTLKDGQTIGLSSIKITTVRGFPGDHFLFLTDQDGALKYVYACDIDRSSIPIVCAYIKKERAPEGALSKPQ